MISEFDDMVGQYVAAVKGNPAAGIADNTVIVVSSDHGDMQVRPQRLSNGSLTAL
jgi:arylsulfatase A-like enzyme